MSLRAGQLLSACLRVSFAAGRVIRSVDASGALGVVDKGKNDPCTLADVGAQKVIVGSLRRYFPGVRVVGEEEVREEEKEAIADLNLECIPEDLLPSPLRQLDLKDVAIWVDPLDGTKGFVQAKRTGVTSLIGISYQGKPVFGFIHEPYSDPPVTYWGGPGLGLRRNTELGASEKLATPAPPLSFSLVTSLHHCSPADLSFLRSLNPSEILTSFGCGHKSMMVVRGEASVYAYPRKGTHMWDTCACEAVVKAVGGIFSDMNGKDLTYNPDAPPQNPAGPLASLSSSLHARIAHQYQLSSSNS